MIEINEQQFIEDFRKQESKLLEKVHLHTSEKPKIVFVIVADHFVVYAIYNKEQKKFTHIEHCIRGPLEIIPL